MARAAGDVCFACQRTQMIECEEVGKRIGGLTKGVSEFGEAGAADEHWNCGLEAEDSSRRVGPGERAKDSREEEEARKGAFVFVVCC